MPQPLRQWFFRSKKHHVRKAVKSARPRLEPLEDRVVPAAPTLAFINDITVPAGETFQVPLDGLDADSGDTLTFSASANTSRLQLSVPTGNRGLFLSASIGGGANQSMIFQLFNDLAPVTADAIGRLANAGFYTNRVFHRIIPDFVAQFGLDQNGNFPNTCVEGTPTPPGPNPSCLATLDDEYHRRLTFNGFGQLAMAKTPDDDSGTGQVFITDVDLAVGSGRTPPQHLNFDHTIFGQIVQGQASLANIIAVGTGSGSPSQQVVIRNMYTFVDRQNGVLRVTAGEGFLGQATVTVRVNDGHGGSAQRTFRVNVIPDTVNDKPFLGKLPALGTTVGKQFSFFVPRTDLEYNRLDFGTSNPSPNATVATNRATGRVVVTPATGFQGTFDLLVAVRDNFHEADPTNALAIFDTQTVPIRVDVNKAPTSTTPAGVTAFRNADLPIILSGTDGDSIAVQSLTFQLKSVPAHGTLRNAAGQVLNVGSFVPRRDLTSASLVYVPTANFTGSDSFRFDIADDGGTASGGLNKRANVNLSITVSPVNPDSAVALTGTKLVVRGTTGNDTVQVGFNVVRDKVIVRLNNRPPQVFARSAVASLDIQGNVGNDKIVVDKTLPYPATVVGGDGNDIIHGGPQSDYLLGGTGNDQMFGLNGNDIMLGQDGQDLLLGGVGSDNLNGGNGGDTLDGGNGNDYLAGSFGSDVLFGSAGRDTLFGGPDADNFGVTDSSDLLAGFTAGSDTRPTGNFRDSSLLGTRAYQLPGAPDIDTAATGFEHRSGTVDYSRYTNPPTYGPHHGFDPGVTPRPTGIYTTPQLDEDLVHNLEHGHVWISYNPDLIDVATRAALEELVNGFGTQNGVILTPRPANDTVITVASWGRLLTFTSLNTAVIRQFILTNRGHSLEGFITP